MRKLSGAVTVLTAAFLAFALASCSTIPFAQRPKNIMRVIDLFNAGKTASLVDASQVPFLFNGEIVELRGDVSTMWTNLVKSGLKIDDPQIVSTSAIGPESYKIFADSFGVKVFFEKYLPKGTALTKVSFKGGSFDLLLDGAHRGYPVVIGIKAGPA